MAISTYSTHHPTAGDTSGTSSSLYDVLDLILEKGLVIDAFVRVSLVGIELLTVDARIVVASVDTYLRFAAATNRLDLERPERRKPGVPELLGYGSQGGDGESMAKQAGRGAAKQAAQSALEAAGGSGSVTDKFADWFCRHAEDDPKDQSDDS
jgi:hypothetical protein